MRVFDRAELVLSEVEGLPPDYGAVKKRGWDAQRPSQPPFRTDVVFCNEHSLSLQP